MGKTWSRKPRCWLKSSPRIEVSSPFRARIALPGSARTGPQILLAWIAKLADHRGENLTKAFNAAGAPAIAQLQWAWDGCAWF